MEKTWNYLHNAAELTAKIKWMSLCCLHMDLTRLLTIKWIVKLNSCDIYIFQILTIQVVQELICEYYIILPSMSLCPNDNLLRGFPFKIMYVFLVSQSNYTSNPSQFSKINFKMWKKVPINNTLYLRNSLICNNWYKCLLCIPSQRELITATMKPGKVRQIRHSDY